MDIKEAFESVNDFSQAKNQGHPYPRQAPARRPVHVWVDSVQSELLEMAAATTLVDQLDAAVDAMYYTADFAACWGMKMPEQYTTGVLEHDLPEAKMLTFDAIEELRSEILMTAMQIAMEETTTDELEDIVASTFHKVQSWFYVHSGISPLEFFEIVHTANMRKINPETRTAYVYKDNGNIGKPEGFVGPEKEIQAKAEELGLCLT